MASVRTCTRRAIVALGVAFALLLMHGGLGQLDDHDPMHASSAAHGATTCASTPAGSASAGHAGVTQAAVVPVSTGPRHVHAPSVAMKAGREPPAPDPVSVLCVSRS